MFFYILWAMGKVMKEVTFILLRTHAIVEFDFSLGFQ